MTCRLCAVPRQASVHTARPALCLNRVRSRGRAENDYWSSRHQRANEPISSAHQDQAQTWAARRPLGECEASKLKLSACTPRACRRQPSCHYAGMRSSGRCARAPMVPPRRRVKPSWPCGTRGIPTAQLASVQKHPSELRPFYWLRALISSHGWADGTTAVGDPDKGTPAQPRVVA